MRFAAGLLSGVLLIFTAAAVLGVEGLPAQLRTQAGALWSSVLERSASRAWSEPESAGRNAPAAPAPAGTTHPVPEPPLAMEPPSTGAAGESPLPPLALSAGSPAELPAGTSPETSAELSAEISPKAAAEPAVVEPMVLEPAAEGTRGTEFIWQAFRSEMSARGFARHLEETLHHPMQVQKASAGRYLVGFRYESAAERETVLKAMSQIMGSTR